ncbi:hypothetical protein CRE_02501 [Caenorhabditis remanei]|uniref:Uncharacterized protein n=1 Tax=Caenorhabditis remanei TaxID=31234 RepID=E3MWV4_CAERE|nr:hypothetical protein CRE_02499 [Caenorhabditis remanei]EFP10753.1 hypothetical protein CRE_02498 [Caenorhabditis remanei]EFP10796.1 hypothetical protein CRE_02500 [Caenorhabditis remanei]EFP10800.1 hypothetical protein CRE_02501 [Caenorhabditis remanei]
MISRTKEIIPFLGVSIIILTISRTKEIIPFLGVSIIILTISRTKEIIPFLGVSIIILTISNPGGFKPASTEENLSPDKYRLLQRHARSV